MDEPIKVKSLEDLREHEAVVVKRINARPNGGQLFLLDPLQMLESVGVRLSSHAVQEIIRLEPASGAPDALAFANLARSQAEQRLTVRLSGLFRPDDQP